MKKIKYWVIYHEYYVYGSHEGVGELIKSEDLNVIKHYFNKYIVKTTKYYNDTYTITKEDDMSLEFTGSDSRYKYKTWIDSKQEIILEDTDIYDNMLYEKVEGWLD